MVICDAWMTDAKEEDYDDEEKAYLLRFDKLITVKAKTFIVKVPGFEETMQ